MGPSRGVVEISSRRPPSGDTRGFPSLRWSRLWGRRDKRLAARFMGPCATAPRSSTSPQFSLCSQPYLQPPRRTDPRGGWGDTTWRAAAQERGGSHEWEHAPAAAERGSGRPRRGTVARARAVRRLTWRPPPHADSGRPRRRAWRHARSGLMWGQPRRGDLSSPHPSFSTALYWFCSSSSFSVWLSAVAAGTARRDHLYGLLAAAPYDEGKKSAPRGSRSTEPVDRQPGRLCSRCRPQFQSVQRRRDVR